MEMIDGESLYAFCTVPQMSPDQGPVDITIVSGDEKKGMC